MVDFKGGQKKKKKHVKLKEGKKKKSQNRVCGSEHKNGEMKLFLFKSVGVHRGI